MSRLPRLRGNQVLAALRQAGFEVVRIRGSHHFLRHQDGRATVVPIHSGEQIGPGLMTECNHRLQGGGFSSRLKARRMEHDDNDHFSRKGAKTQRDFVKILCAFAPLRETFQQ